MTAVTAGIGGWGVAWLCAGIGAAVVVAGCGIGAAVLALLRLCRPRPRTPGIRHLHAAATAAHDRREPVTRPLALGDFVVSPEQERHAQFLAARLRETRADGMPVVACHRCRTGSLAWQCTCSAECWAAYCTGGMA